MDTNPTRGSFLNWKRLSGKELRNTCREQATRRGVPLTMVLAWLHVPSMRIIV